MQGKNGGITTQFSFKINNGGGGSKQTNGQNHETGV